MTDAKQALARFADGFPVLKVAVVANKSENLVLTFRAALRNVGDV